MRPVAGDDRGSGPGGPAGLLAEPNLLPVRRRDRRRLGRVARVPGSAAAGRGSSCLRAEGGRVCGLSRPGFDWRVFTADGALILAVQPPTGRPGLADAVGELHELVTLATAAGRHGRINPEDFLVEVLLANSPR